MPNLYTLTGDLDDQIGGDGITVTKAYLQNNLPRGTALVDTTNNKIRLGATDLSWETGHVFTLDGIFGSDSTDLNVPVDTLQYQVVVEYRGGGAHGSGRHSETWTSGWFFLNASSNLADLATSVTPAPVTATLDSDVAGLINPTSQTGVKLDTFTRDLVNDPASATTGALSATYGTVYRPERYGAVGDGVADDLPAFKAMADAIAADINTPALIEITGEHYLSDSVMFDAEHLEVHLAEGSHVFCTAATTHGGTLGFIGHREFFGTANQADTAPRRGSVKVHGSGKVTGWAGGANENAIGIVRFDRVLVDGPYVNAGNKGVTAQIGCPDVIIRKIKSDACGVYVVSVEDQAQAVSTTVEDIEFGTSGDRAIFVSAARVDVRRIRGTEAHLTSGSTSSGAVHVTTTTTLSWAQVVDVDIADANTAKGVVISQAQNGVVDRIRIGASGDNAVDIFNCPNGLDVGTVSAPASPAGAVATGTTPADKIRRTRSSDTRRALTSGEATIDRTAVSSTAISLPTGLMRLGYFEAAKTETITKVRVISGGSVPTGGTITLMRVGVYSVDDATGALTLVASTANDTAYPAAANTAYTKNLSASFVKRAGQRYAVGLLGVYSGGSLQVPGNSTAGGIGSEAAQSPRLSAAVGSLGDLPSSQTVTSAHDTSAMPYFVLVP